MIVETKAFISNEMDAFSVISAVLLPDCRRAEDCIRLSFIIKSCFEHVGTKAFISQMG